jgi:hypothetical protein
MRSPPEHGDGDRLISGRTARAGVAVAPRAGAHVRGAPGRRRGGWQAWRRLANGGRTRRGVIHAPSPGSGFGACGLGAESARRIVDRDASCQSRRATFYPRRRVAGGQVESV